MADNTPALRASGRVVGTEPVATALPELSLQDIAEEGEEALVARGVAYVRQYAVVEYQPTILLRNIAKVLVALRTKFRTSDGETDLLGKTNDYRQAAARIYSSAGVSPDSQSNVQAAVRYHIGNILRDEFPEKTLAAYKLRALSPKERLQEKQARNASVLAVARAEAASTEETVPTKVTADHLRMASGTVGVLKSLSVEHIRTKLTPGQRSKLDAQLAEAQDVIRTLRRVIKSAGT